MATYDGKKCSVECECGKDYVLTKSNTQVIHFFEEGIIFAESHCSCGAEHDNFIDEGIMTFLKNKNVDVIEAEGPPANLVRQWMELHPEEWKPVTQHEELNPRQERQIEVLRWELEGVVTPQDILDVPIENRLPRRWD